MHALIDILVHEWMAMYFLADGIALAFVAGGHFGLVKKRVLEGSHSGGE